MTNWQLTGFLGLRCLLHFGAIRMGTVPYLSIIVLWLCNGFASQFCLILRLILAQCYESDTETRIQTIDVLWITMFKDLHLRLKIKAFRERDQVTMSPMSLALPILHILIFIIFSLRTNPEPKWDQSVCTEKDVSMINWISSHFWGMSLKIHG